MRPLRPLHPLPPPPPRFASFAFFAFFLGFSSSASESSSRIEEPPFEVAMSEVDSDPFSVMRRRDGSIRSSDNGGNLRPVSHLIGDPKGPVEAGLGVSGHSF